MDRYPDVPTGQRISDLKKAEGNGESRQAPETLQTPDPGTPDEPAPPDQPATLDQPATPDKPDKPETPPARTGLSRRRALTVLGIGAGALIAEQALVADGIPPAAGPAGEAGSVPPEPGGYAPDGTAGRAVALPLDAVELLESPFRQNQARNTSYLLFLDPERMLRSFRLNYGDPSEAEPLGF